MEEIWETLKTWWSGIDFLHQFLPILVILIAGLLIIKVILSVIARTLKRSKLDKAAHGLIRSVVRIVLYVLLGMIVASGLGIDVTGVVALTSVISLALSLAFQDSLTNLIGGFTLLYTHPFSAGDYVEMAEQAGTVQEIGIAYTKLQTPDGKIVSIPNSSVITAEIVNYTVSGMRRLDITVTTTYDAPVEQVLTALREAADVPDKIQEKGIFTEVMNYGDKGIEFSVRVWTSSANYWPVKFSINRRIDTIFKREGLRMSYPQIQVHTEQ